MLPLGHTIPFGKYGYQWLGLAVANNKAPSLLLALVCSQQQQHSARYNVKKSELLVFKAGNKWFDTVPPFTLGGTPLTRVSRFKNLGH